MRGLYDTRCVRTHVYRVCECVNESRYTLRTHARARFQYLCTCIVHGVLHSYDL